MLKNIKKILLVFPLLLNANPNYGAANQQQMFQNMTSANFQNMMPTASKTDIDAMYTKITNAFKQIKPNYIIHLAANVGGLFKNLENQVDMLETNLMINLNVIKSC